MEQAQLREQEALCLDEAHSSKCHLPFTAENHLNPLAYLQWTGPK